MYGGKTVLAIIPARGGSKGVPGKNIRKFAGLPLLAWTILEARKSKYIDRLILSTDDEKIMKVAGTYGCEVPFRRPPELAADDTPGIAPVLHALYTLPEKYDYIVLLQPTSPLRLTEDIDGCLKFCIGNNGAPACVTVTDPAEPPYWMYTVGDGAELEPLFANKQNTPRQVLPKTYVLNGAVYVAECGWLQENKTFTGEGTRGYFMPRERSVDIDTEQDFNFCQYLFQRYREAKRVGESE